MTMPTTIVIQPLAPHAIENMFVITPSSDPVWKPNPKATRLPHEGSMKPRPTPRPASSWSLQPWSP